MDQHSKPSPSFINITVLLLFALVIAVVSVATTYFILNSRSNEQYSASQPTVVSPPQTYVQPTSPPVDTTTVSDETTSWKVYRNERYRFEFKYPPFFIPNSSNVSIDYLAYFTGKDNNISVEVNSISRFKYMDLGAQEYFFDSTSKKLVNYLKPNEPIKEIRGANSNVKGYELGWGDSACSGLLTFIPDPTYTYIVTVSNSYCWKYDESTQEFVDIPYHLSNSQLISTFKFLK